MHFLSRLTSSNSEGAPADFAVFTIDADRAKGLLELHERTIELLLKMDERGLACRHYYVSMGSDLAYFGAHSYTDALGEALGEEGFVMLNEPLCSPEDDSFVRCECFRVNLQEDSITFQALARHQDDALTTASIPVSVLKKLASGS